ncbi:MAG: protein TolR [Nitrospirae bacterium CG_4_10_14_3_um_filter_44_29]|nr:protein TolR [Nitrospirota bacterium]OIO29646.1 MAG: protein TolR [Nitrospirae bacterium CG1_02_44_142]PIP71271.1 MAG: protein TolR [Nitrospirae bacterium CG22_combo_CG10-13_8_21_14_all_44_11]PIV43944.1 MAG: protein TolR [Nitrospirae bacterium CG02_land_8_20_14_3_00_44_33]PIV67046.1 MAG: protein TolR [Nitrospirae bacterium CG01_land_8_20_14_3_00_44_22]PIW89060.1 MAG: protein TolR [Nitrospirae bacterium CG_4_8_14_3_um_filter_44_28]PIX89625.1 MAG: protein TolR [Nitrospirae bacterium CG_4_10_
MKAGRNRDVLSEINVTPFVDVMLVLLIIFMVTAPLLQQGIDVNLPQAKGKDLPTEERITLIVKKGGIIFMNDKPMSMSEIKQKLTAISKLNPNVFLKADKDVPYGFVVQVMSDIKEAGIEKLGMITEPKINIEGK